MADATPTPSSEGLEKLLSNPELLRTIAALTGTGGGVSNAQDAPPAQTSSAVQDGLARALADPELMAKLPEVMAMLRPMLQGGASAEAAAPTSAPVHASPQASCRNDLLLALKPFLSSERAAAIDLLLRLGKLGSVLNALK